MDSQTLKHDFVICILKNNLLYLHRVCNFTGLWIKKYFDIP